MYTDHLTTVIDATTWRQMCQTYGGH